MPAKKRKGGAKLAEIAKKPRKDAQAAKQRSQKRRMLVAQQEGARAEGKHWEKYLSQDKFNPVSAAKKHGRRMVPPILSKSSFVEGTGKAVKQAKKVRAALKVKKK